MSSRRVTCCRSALDGASFDSEFALLNLPPAQTLGRCRGERHLVGISTELKYKGSLPAFGCIQWEASGGCFSICHFLFYPLQAFRALDPLYSHQLFFRPGCFCRDFSVHLPEENVRHLESLGSSHESYFIKLQWMLFEAFTIAILFIWRAGLDRDKRKRSSNADCEST